MRVNTGVGNIIDSNTKMFSYTILLYSLTGKNECELCRKPCMSKHPLRHQHTIQSREIYQMSPITNKSVRKDDPISHQRAHTSELGLKKTESTSSSFNTLLKESIFFLQKLTILPFLNVRLHINYRLHLPNI